MPKPREEYLHILVRSRAYLAPLKMMGPIVHPLKVNKKAVIQLLLNSCEVVEYVPKTGNTIPLSLTNINDNGRYSSEDIASLKEVKTPVKPVRVDGVPVETKPESNEKAPADPETPKDESKEQVVETEDKVEETQTEPVVDDIIANYPLVMKDGKVDESDIEWNQFTKAQRRALRNRINEMNGNQQ